MKGVAKEGCRRGHGDTLPSRTTTMTIIRRRREPRTRAFGRGIEKPSTLSYVHHV